MNIILSQMYTIKFLPFQYSRMYQTIATHDAESQYMSNGKIVLFSFFNCQNCETEYYYADRLPCEIKVFRVLAVLACILATPIALLCCVPAVLSLKKVCYIDV